MTVAVYTVPY